MLPLLMAGLFALPQAVVVEARVAGGDQLSDAARGELDEVIEQPRSDGTADALAVLAATERQLVVRRDQSPLLIFPTEEERAAGWKRIAPEIAKRVGGHLVVLIAPGPDLLHLAIVDGEGVVRGERDTRLAQLSDAVGELVASAGGGTNALLVPAAGRVPLRIELDPPTRSLDVSLFDGDEPTDWICGTPCTLQLEPGPVRVRVGSGMHAEAIRNLTLPADGARVRFRVYPEWLHVSTSFAVDLGIVGLTAAALTWLLYEAGSVSGDVNSDGSTSAPRFVGYLALSSIALIVVGEIVSIATRTRATLVPGHF